MSSTVWFWQRMVSPHMAGLASAVAELGMGVTYVAEQPMSDHRVAQGWLPPDLKGARLVYTGNAQTTIATAQSAPPDSVHICQGLRGNGLVALAQRVLSDRKLRQWVVMETLDKAGWRGFVRRLEYSRLIAARQRAISGYLAIGHETPDWLARRGAPKAGIFPFAYFLPDVAESILAAPRLPGPFRILFVGRFIELKCLDMLIGAAAACNDAELHVIGSGPLEDAWRRMGTKALGSRLHWIGRVPSTDMPRYMTQADLLVLPSRYDGWGAVVSESMMAGTPAMCSDRCGSAGAVKASGHGGVFPGGDPSALTHLLRRLVDQGPPSRDRRTALAQWARRLGARAGADYLTAILASNEDRDERPTPPWMISENAV